MKEKFRAAYSRIEIPKSLDPIMENTLRRHQKRRKILFRPVAIPAACFLILVGALNFSPVFASAVGEIPIIGDIARMFTLRSEHSADKNKVIDINRPYLELNGNSDLENHINLQIEQLINREVKEASDRAEEYFQAVEETGGRDEEYMPLAITIGYDLKYSSPEVVSFLIYKMETLASAYQSNHFYNIDLSTGRDLTLRDFLGDDYQQIAMKSIQKQIANFDSDLKQMVFEEVDIGTLIDENRSFYIAADGKTPVIVFEKYEIAAGAAGMLEFPITRE